MKGKADIQLTLNVTNRDQSKKLFQKLEDNKNIFNVRKI